MSIVLTIALVLCVLAVFVPLLRPRPAPEYYVGSPPEERQMESRTKLQSILAELRQDFDSGKLSAEEFSQMAGPLARQLESLAKGVQSAAKKQPAESCPACGHRSFSGLCRQCGFDSGAAQ